jgi:ABC-2 type transport system permease protein
LYLVPMALGVMVMIALVFAALGVAIGSSLQDMQGFQLIMNFGVMPIYFLSGALFPLVGVGKVLGTVAAFDPLSYGIDGMRCLLLSRATYQPAYGLFVDVLVLTVVGAILMVFGAYRFSKIEI